MTQPVFTSCRDAVNNELLETNSSALDELWTTADDGASPRELETTVWRVLLELGRLLLMYLLALQCRRAMEEDLRMRGLTSGEIRIRNDRNYWMTTKTTLGLVRFPTFAYRDLSSGVVSVTRSPARDLFPLREYCLSSELLLEWETRLGSDHPFRRAQEAMTFFTHGAVTEEDTTIADHMVAVGRLMDRDWSYRTADDIKEILLTRATRDVDSGRPILYASTDGECLWRLGALGGRSCAG